MKKIIIGMAIAAIFFLSCDTSARELASQSQDKVATTAITSIPIPTISYFQERRTISKWAVFWDKPNLPTYVYLFAFDKCIGYFVADGKPASTRSYIMPEQKVETSLSGDPVVDAPDIDGTYGDNNPGYRFFTASGIPVEWGGQGASLLYSAFPIALEVPKLEMKHQ